MTDTFELRQPRWIHLRPSATRTVKDVRPYDPTDSRYLRRDRCFLCGRRLTPTTRTAEHVFPKWLLDRYRLWDAQLALLNGSLIPYRKIQIPCCKACNGIHLAALERRVEKAVAGGYRTFRRLPPAVVFQWLTKIFFQILYMEMRLAMDVRDPSRGTILTPGFLDDFRLEHALLNSVRMPVRVSPPPPWSIFVLRAQVSTIRERNFDFVDNLHGQVVAIRMGEVAVIALLMDGHAQQDIFRPYFSKVARYLRLHPIQFRELATKAIYKRSTMNRTPKFVTVWPEHQASFDMVSVPLAGFSSRPIFETWDQEKYARILHFIAGAPYGIPFERLFEPPNLAMTFLRNRGNRWTRIPMDADTLDGSMQRSS
jgi:hypothetical protein